jgi:hypothetical protein
MRRIPLILGTGQISSGQRGRFQRFSRRERCLVDIRPVPIFRSLGISFGPWGQVECQSVRVLLSGAGRIGSSRRRRLRHTARLHRAARRVGLIFSGAPGRAVGRRGSDALEHFALGQGPGVRHFTDQMEVIGHDHVVQEAHTAESLLGARDGD